MTDATQVLTKLSGGEESAASQLLPIVYHELRQIAAAYLRHQRKDHTLQTTALVHEAYLKLINQSQASWNDRAHFLAVAATAMRQILVNHAHRRQAVKRGGGRARATVDVERAAVIDVNEGLLALHEALQELERLDPRKNRVVEARFFGGMTMEEIAHALSVSKSTVENDWRMARAWLSQRLSAESGP